MSSANDQSDLLASANDERLEAGVRRAALLEYFRRRASRVPLSLAGAELFGDPRLAGWFTPDRLRDMTSGSRMPVDRHIGQGVVLFMPRFTADDSSSVYLLLSEQASVDQIVGWARDPASCPASIQVVQIGFGQSTPGPGKP